MIGYLLTAAAATLVTGAGYNSMAPRSQLFGATFTGLGGGSRRLALTYDDGPNDPHTLRLLEVLDRHQVKATFFMLGQHVAQRPQIAQAVAAAGHEIGNHTYTHPNLIFVSTAQLARQIDACARAIEHAVGAHSRLFRPPFGGRRPQVLTAVRKQGYVPVMWSVTAHDWDARAAESIEATVARQLRGGDVILMHDGAHLAMGADRSPTVTATGRLIRRYKDEGFSFATVSEMMAAGR